MGGSDSLLSKAGRAFERGEYRWVAQVVNHLVFADPSNAAARSLQADALEQLGYQAESGPWRDAYLTGAKELREGVVPETATRLGIVDVIRGMPLDLLFDFLSVMLDGPKAAGKALTINFEFKDTKEKYGLRLENSVLNYTKRRLDPQPDLTLILNRAVLDQIVLGMTKLDDKIARGEVKAEGRREALDEVLGLLDKSEFWFNIVMP
jgi:alkyl sulfatase BDS1-like metallo-beta-lactamase superfamily hydrolase